MVLCKMWLRKKILVLYIISATSLIIFISLLHILVSDVENDNFNFEKFNNANASKHILIPNIVHYVMFKKSTINFITYLSILSVIKVQNPKKILIHCDNNEFTEKYWNKLNQIKTNTSLKLIYMLQPTHVYGQKLSSVYHATDVARIQVLNTYGGIYLDNDVIFINKVDKLRYYEMVVGLPKNDYMGTQVLMANKNSRFLNLWLKGYQHYQPRDWYYNAGRVPTKILQDFPFLAHKEEEKFGVHNLLDKLHSFDKWNEWKYFYTVHLLSRHEPTPKDLNETIVQKLNTNFGDIARYVLNL